MSTACIVVVCMNGSCCCRPRSVAQIQLLQLKISLSVPVPQPAALGFLELSTTLVHLIWYSKGYVTVNLRMKLALRKLHCIATILTLHQQLTQLRR